MAIINVTNARKNLYQLITEVNASAEPIMIMNNKGKNAVLISEEDWRAIEETLYLTRVPGLVESILAGAQEPLSECKRYDPADIW